MGRTLTITPDPGNDAVIDRLRAAIPASAANTANVAATAAQAALVKRMRQVFDRPTPAILAAVKVSKATSANPTSSVFIGASGPGVFANRLNTALSYEDTGGVEQASATRRTWNAIPIGAPTNAYGALGRGGVRKLLSEPNTFIGRISGREGSYGVYMRTTRGHLQLLALLRTQTTYRPLLQFAATVQTAVQTSVAASAPGSLTAT